MLFFVDLRKLGQTTQVAKSSVDEVREKIASLRATATQGSKSQSYDFQARLQQIAQEQEREERERRARRKANKRAAKEKAAASQTQDVDEDVMAAMGFGGFGSTKKR